MHMSGEWYLFEDGIARPVIRGEILARDGAWVRAPFLVDTGADRTVFSAAILTLLRLQPIATQERLGGLGGIAGSVDVETRIRLTHEAAITLSRKSSTVCWLCLFPGERISISATIRSPVA